MATNNQITQATTGEYIAYYVDTDRVLYRERDGWPGEILNGSKWQGYPFSHADVRQITPEEAKQLAGSTPIDAPATGINPITAARLKDAGYDGGDAEGSEPTGGTDGEDA